VPRGCPVAVSPPGSEDWETTAAAWLLDLVPEYRQYPAVRRHPVVLAFITRHVLTGAIEGTRQGYWTTRTELGEVAAPDVVATALADFRTEGRRLSAALRFGPGRVVVPEQE
jgi:hypothetical protein